MDKSQETEIKAALTALQNPCDLDSILICAVPHDHQVEGPGPRTGLLHPRFREDLPLVDDLARILFEQCVYYALPRRKRIELHEQVKNDVSKAVRITTLVRDVFIEFNARYPSRASELGEVLAYCIAQRYLSAPQVAAKMALKTASNMPIHGLDGVHAAFENEALTVYFLEAKLAGAARVGATRYAQSAAEFLADKKQYDREYQLIGDLGHFDSLVGEARETAIDYFDIWNKPELPRRERFVGVICHSAPKHYADKLPVDDGPVEVHQNHFSKIYGADHAALRAFANNAIVQSGGNPAKATLFFVAVPDVNELRKAFYRALGLPIPDALPDDADDVMEGNDLEVTTS